MLRGATLREVTAAGVTSQSCATPNRFEPVLRDRFAPTSRRGGRPVAAGLGTPPAWQAEQAALVETQST